MFLILKSCDWDATSSMIWHTVNANITAYSHVLLVMWWEAHLAHIGTIQAIPIGLFSRFFKDYLHQ